ncbi:hypothetical protein BDZ85DRAFT_280047 [Elsinoe ampelina]|uniref:Indole-diterpene biosynthesis protein PaxU n=1 Tax=Elsinoe ampelina TaxID=302913 RepID=A0A6A6GGT6_9PEZI|nr:hypothetical protein BDZ85DRAFT_280047 [Elsinoe ampelina]
MATNPTNPLPLFHPISPQILYHSPPPTSHSSPPPPDHPALILLCTWASASRRNIAKYTATYTTLYPSTPILILESTVTDMVFATDASQARAFAPARDVILSTLATAGSGSVLLHVFSNGGAQTAGRLMVSLPVRERERLLKGVVLDSCPGGTGMGRSADAMRASLPRTWVWGVVGWVVVWVVLLGVMVVEVVFGVENVVSVARRRLVDPEVVGREVPRVYLYGKKDKMVWWEDVAAHVREAREGCERVEEVRFEDGDHCAYIVKNDREYWEAITNLVGGKR